MENFLIPIIIAAIVFAKLYKQLNKNQSEETTQGHAAPAMPQRMGPKPGTSQPRKRDRAMPPADLQENRWKTESPTHPQSAPTASIPSNENDEDFTIRSAEEARRAVILGEILQRKY